MAITTLVGYNVGAFGFPQAKMQHFVNIETDVISIDLSWNWSLYLFVTNDHVYRLLFIGTIESIIGNN